jgi:ribosome-interacting GTPase 1
MVDQSDDDGPFAAESVLERLAETKTVLVGQPPAAPEDLTIQHIRTLLIANKCDLPGADDRLAVVRELYGARFPVHVVSAEHGAGMEELRTEIYRFLNMIRVYTKKPGKPPDMNSPFTCPVGSTLLELASLVHRDFAEQLKSARIWGTGVYEGQTVTRDHVLHDKDVVELHV